MNYRIFDIVLACDFSLPGLPQASGGAPDWTVSLGPDALDDSGFAHVHNWPDAKGRSFMECWRDGSIYLIKFNEIATYLLNLDDKEIRVFPVGDCPQNTLAHLLVDQVVPRALCHQGRVVLHASAVSLADGPAVAFTGPSGRGKSTLALALHQAGHRLLSDDCLLLERQNGRVVAIPAYPSVRLWKDSFEAMHEAVDEDTAVAAMAHYTSKQQLYFPGESDLEDTGRPAIQRLYVLSEAGSGLEVEEISVRPVSGSESIMALVESQFTLDVADKSSVERNFRAVAEIAQQVPVYRLQYPRRFDALEQVVDIVVSNAQ